MRKELGEMLEDGKLSKEEIAKLRDAAVDRLIQMLGGTGMNEVAKVLGLKGAIQVRQYLSGVVEVAVAALAPTLVHKAGAVNAPSVPGAAPVNTAVAHPLPTVQVVRNGPLL